MTIQRAYLSRVLMSCLALLIACAEERAPLAAGDSNSTITQPADNGLAYWPGSEWRTEVPNHAGMDATKISQLVQNIRSGSIADIHSLVIVKNGFLVTEEYFNGSTRAELHTLQSVTKSITSLLMGIAVRQGAIASVDAPFLSYFPEYKATIPFDARRERVTLRHVLSMTSGIDFYENPYAGSPLQRLNDSRGDWLDIVFGVPMNDEPGGHWQYNSGAVIALGGVLRNATGKAADEFARTELFDKIGVQNTFWYKGAPNGLPHMGGGLNMRAIDLARIGYLVLRKGRWNEQTIVNPEWIATSTTPVVTPQPFFPRASEYGHLWWLFPLTTSPARTNRDDWVVAASGNYGQWLFVVPKLDLVVVVTAGAQTGANMSRPLEFLFSDIIPSVK